MAVTKGGNEAYTLAEIIEKQKELVNALKLNYNKLKLASSGKAFRTIDKEQLILKQKDLRERLVKTKVVINQFNLKIYHEIYQLSELKVSLAELKMANLPKFNEQIKFTETEIKRIEEALKKHNESVKVAWFQMIGTRLYDPII